MSEDLYKRLKELATDYPNLDVKEATLQDGKLQVKVGLKTNAQIKDLPEGVEVIREEPLRSPHDVTGNSGKIFTEKAGTPNRLTLDVLSRDYLDLSNKAVNEMSPKELYCKAIEYYRTKPVYGGSIDVLSNFASKGFENDIDDPTIKNFFDTWVIDTGFDVIVEKIFLDLIRVGLVRTYKILGKYEPKINNVSTIPGATAKRVSKEFAAKKDTYSKNYLPIAYTILNPIHVKIKGSMMFGRTSTFLDAAAGKELRDLLKLDPSDLSDFDRKLLKSIPSGWKKAAENNEDLPLDQNLVGEVDYRRMPYERYPYPRGARAFDSVDFNDDLRQADSSTLDGITSYILKITVGNDTFPVTKQETLDTVSKLFDTVSKSYKVVYNHTLDVEKISSPEILEILGKEKYEQSNEDITGGIFFPRALLDGIGNADGQALQLAIKNVIEEINYLRTQVKRWIYKEYRQVAEAVGFDQYPTVRFDDMALRDEIAMMSIIQGMIDRRIISYYSGQKKLGFNPAAELAQMQREKELVLAGDIGVIGSPYQKSSGDGGIQPTQRTPSGTPSEGRPRGAPAKTPSEKDKTKVKPKKKKQKIDTTKASMGKYLSDLSLEELQDLYEKINKKK